jgi:hypothetical protein
MQSSYTRCEVHWGWRRDFRISTVKCGKFVIFVQQISNLNIKLIVSSYAFIITIHNVFVFVDCNSSTSVNIKD